jgi:hypothetical protein
MPISTHSRDCQRKSHKFKVLANRANGPFQIIIHHPHPEEARSAVSKDAAESDATANSRILRDGPAALLRMRFVVKLYSAALAVSSGTGSRMVTNSSAEVG